MFGKARPRPKNNGAQWPIQAGSNDDVPISEICGNLMSPVCSSDRLPMPSFALSRL
jgi:hypothetical protein